MRINIIPNGSDFARIRVDGEHVGNITRVAVDGKWRDLSGTDRIGGHRWLPVGMPANLTPGPGDSKAEATALLLTDQGWPSDEVVKHLPSLTRPGRTYTKAAS